MSGLQGQLQGGFLGWAGTYQGLSGGLLPDLKRGSGADQSRGAGNLAVDGPLKTR